MKPYCNLLQTMLEAIVYTTDYIAHYTIDHGLLSDFTIDHKLDYRLYNMLC